MGLCESLNLGHTESSHFVRLGTMLFLLAERTRDGGVGPRRVLQPSGRGHREAKLPLGSFGQDEGPVRTLGKSRGGGRRCLTEAPGEKGWKQAQAQLAPCNTHSCKTSCVCFLS